MTWILGFSRLIGMYVTHFTGLKSVTQVDILTALMETRAPTKNMLDILLYNRIKSLISDDPGEQLYVIGAIKQILVDENFYVHV